MLRLQNTNRQVQNFFGEKTMTENQTTFLGACLVFCFALLSAAVCDGKTSDTEDIIVGFGMFSVFIATFVALGSLIGMRSDAKRNQLQ